MRAALRVAVKDLVEMSASGRAMLLVLLCPCLFIILIGNLRPEPITLRLLLAAGDAEKEVAETAAAALHEIELVSVTIAEASDDLRDQLERGGFDLLAVRQKNRWLFSTAVTDPFRFGVVQQTLPRLRALLDSAEEEISGHKAVLTALEQLGTQLASIRRIADDRLVPPPLQAVQNLAAPGPGTPPSAARPATQPSPMALILTTLDSSLVSVRAAVEVAAQGRPEYAPLSTLMFTLADVLSRMHGAALSTEGTTTGLFDEFSASALAMQQAVSELQTRMVARSIPMATVLRAAAPTDGGDFLAYYPRASDRPRALLPQAVALVVCLLAFVLACTALVREREEQTIDVLLSLPQIGPVALLAGKCAAAVALTTVCFLLLLGVLHTLFGIYIKDGLLPALVLVVIPGAIVAALQGLVVSTWVTSSLQSTVAAALYLLVQSLVGGFLYPVSTDSPGLFTLISLVFPLTFVSPTLEMWALGRSPVWLSTFVPLVGLAAVHAVATRLAWYPLHKRL